jgi:hypothetical protein
VVLAFYRCRGSTEEAITGGVTTDVNGLRH